MKLFLAILLICSLQSDIEVGQKIFFIELKENLKLSSFNISRSVKLNETEYILIGKNKIQTLDDDGLCMIYLTADSSDGQFRVKYISKSKSEAYVYEPHFFKFQDELIMVVEEGYEFMSGIDIYRLKYGVIDFLGYVPVSGDKSDRVVDKIKVERQSNNYTLSFAGRVEYKIATDNIIDGAILKVRIDKNGLRIYLNDVLQK